MKVTNYILFTLLLTSCVLPEDKPVHIVEPESSLIHNFNQLDSGFVGFIYFDAKNARSSKSFKILMDVLINEPEPFTYNGHSSKTIQDIFNDLQFDPYYDLNHLVLTVYQSNGSDEEDLGFAAIINGQFDRDRWLLEFDNSHPETFQKGRTEWFIHSNKDLFIAFKTPTEVWLTSNPDYFISNLTASSKVKGLLDSKFDNVKNQNYGIGWFDWVNQPEKVYQLGNKGNKMELSSDDLKEIRLWTSFSDSLEFTSSLDMKNEDGLTAASLIANSVIGFMSFQNWVSGNKDLTNFIEIEKQDSSLVISLVLPATEMENLIRNSP